MAEAAATGCALVVGASRGLGLAIADWLLMQPSISCVYATHRGNDCGDGLRALGQVHGQRLQLLACDVSEDQDLQKLATRISADQQSLNLVMHCAGILHETGIGPEKALVQLRRAALARVFDVNTFGPILLAQAVLPLMAREATTHFAVLSAMVGSIGDNRLGGWYAYRASKAALNQLMKTLAIEAKRRYPLLCVSSVHPGTTDTGLSRPFQANVPAERLYTPAQSAARIMQVVLGGGPDDTGRFVNWDGSILPW